MSISLEDAQDEFRSKLADGDFVVCPCCEIRARIYHRPFNKNMALGLIWMVWYWERHGKDWVEMPTVSPRFIYQNQDFAKAKHWGLVERKENDDDAKHTSGLWRPTELGVTFAKGLATIPGYVWLFADTPLMHDEDAVSIYDALLIPFDYAALMADADPVLFTKAREATKKRTRKKK